MDKEPVELDKFTAIYRNIIARLDEAKEKGYLSDFSCGVIISLIHRVAYKMTVNRKNVQRKVGDLMGGKVLDLEIIRARHEGIEKGIAEERKDNIRKLAASYMKNDTGMTEEKAIEIATKILS